MITTFTISPDKGRVLAAAMVSSRKRVFREETDTVPHRAGAYEYMPWGADDQMPFDILDLIETDEVMTACQNHNIRTLYAGGLRYECEGDEPLREMQRFIRHNDLNRYYMGVCTDMRYWGWCVSVITLSNDGSRIVSLSRREAMYCRLAPADSKGQIPYILYANFRKTGLQSSQVEKIPVLKMDDPYGDLRYRMGQSAQARAEMKSPTPVRKFAIVSRITTPDTTYYPIPPYGALFKGRWYDIKNLISTAKYAKLKHSAPLKYLVEIEDGYWDKRFQQKGAVTEAEMQAEVNRVKQEMIDFLTGAENSGKALFSGYYIDPQTGHEVHEIKVTNLESKSEGGDWQTDIQEAINMICFTMGVHSNLVGSVPGNAQSNNSGSDKRELYTIAQCMEQPVREILMLPHRLVIDYNGWRDTYPRTSIVQLTTLDRHRDVFNEE